MLKNISLLGKGGKKWITDGASATLCCAALPPEWVGKCMAEFALIKPKTSNCHMISFV
jgi:hypothetical protein